MLLRIIIYLVSTGGQVAWTGPGAVQQADGKVTEVLVVLCTVKQCTDTSDTEHALLSSVSDGHCRLQVSVGKCDNNVLMFIVSAPSLINHNKQFI